MSQLGTGHQDSFPKNELCVVGTCCSGKVKLFLLRSHFLEAEAKSYLDLPTGQDGTTWMWAADAPEEDDTWKFTENGEGFSFLA